MDVTWSMWWTIGVVAGGIVAALVLLDLWMIWRRRQNREDTNTQMSRRDERLVPATQRNSAMQTPDGRDGQPDPERERVRSYNLRPLSDRECDRYVERWRVIQADFVNNPGDAVARADELIVAVMMARGYPGASDADLRTKDLRVDYPGAADSYGWAHNAMVVSQNSQLREEDMRNAMIQYGHVFETLVPARVTIGDGTRGQRVAINHL